TLIALLVSDRDVCLVQSYIAGRNLEQVLQAEGPWNEAQVRSLLTTLLPVLQFIHGQGIIHRDIKPENILLPDGDALPILVDFGAARPVPTAPELAATGTVIGSAGYAAPEQALGKAVPASDLYGLGVTCLHLLTGVHPFDLYDLATDRWVWQPLTTQPVGAALAQVLDRLAARSLRSRYATAAAALADLAPAGIMAVRSPTALEPCPPQQWEGVATWPTPGRIVNAVAVSPAGQAIATANSDHTVQLWDRQTGDVLHTFAQRWGWGAGHRDAVTAVQFHPDGRSLFTGSQDSTFKQWDLRHYHLQHTQQAGGWQVTAIALTPNGDTLITATADGRLTLWDLPQNQRRCDLVRHTGAINDLAVSPDGTRLISVGEEGTLRLWALPTGQLLHTWTAAVGLRAVALLPSEPALITGSQRGEVTQWSLTDFDDHTLLGQHQDAVSALAVSPDGRWLATGSRDREIHLWDWTHTPPRQVATRHHAWAVCDLVFTPDSQTLISSAADGTIRFWQATPAAGDRPPAHPVKR
ncbi:MAG TPA: serine/threonine-protein kinase, partial [Candidatus Obscuribacterales bacterium]